MDLFDQDITELRVVVKEIASWEILLYFNKMSVGCRFIFDLAFNTECGDNCNSNYAVDFIASANYIYPTK